MTFIIKKFNGKAELLTIKDFGDVHPEDRSVGIFNSHLDILTDKYGWICLVDNGQLFDPNKPNPANEIGYLVRHAYQIKLFTYEDFENMVIASQIPF